MPDRLAAYRRTWLDLHPDWEWHLWSEDNMPPLRNQRLYDDAERIAPGSVGQFRSDVARYELLAVYGGVYVDMDMECLRSIDTLLSTAGRCWFAYEDPQHRWVNNAVCGGRPGHPFLNRLIQHLPVNVARWEGHRKRPNVLSGPQFVTAERNSGSEWQRAVTVLPHRLFYPYLYSEVGTPRERGPWPEDTYAVHHWHNTRTNGRRARRRRAQAGARRV